MAATAVSTTGISQEKKNELFKAARAKLGYGFTRVGTPQHDKVLELYDEMLMKLEKDPVKLAWRAALQRVTKGKKKFIRMTDPQYLRVRAAFDEILDGMAKDGMPTTSKQNATTAKRRLDFFDNEAVDTKHGGEDDEDGEDEDGEEEDEDGDVATEDAASADLFNDPTKQDVNAGSLKKRGAAAAAATSTPKSRRSRR